MTKSKKLLSVLAAVLLMTVMTFATVFAASGNPDRVSISLRSDQAYARAGVTCDTNGPGHMKGTNDATSRSTVSMIARASRTNSPFWKNCTEIALPNTGKEVPGKRDNPYSGKNIQWSLELRSKDNAQGCTARGTICVDPF